MRTIQLTLLLPPMICAAVAPSAVAVTLVVDCVSGPYHTIQDAIDVANPGDEVLVMPCIYHEAINFLDKDITVRSHAGPARTTIDASDPNSPSPVVTCAGGQSQAARLIGFTITGAHNNDDGGGMYNQDSNPLVLNCIFFENIGPADGAGMYNLRSSPTVVNCAFIGNSVTGGITQVGGGMVNIDGSNPLVINCTFSGNSVTGGTNSYGGGIANLNGSTPIIVNCVIWGNTVVGSSDEIAQVYDDPSSATTITYSCIQGCTTFCADLDNHNIGDDPQLVAPACDDFRLGRGSPCIDAGDSTAVPPGLFVDLGDLGRLLDDWETVDSGVPVGLVPVTVDMGAYEYHKYQLVGDINGDSRVDFRDINPFVLLVTQPCW